MTEQPPAAETVPEATPDTSTATPRSGRPTDRLRLAGANQRQVLGLVAVLALLVAAGSVTTENFFQISNLVLLLTQASIIGVVSIGMTFVIISGGIDLSVGAIIALASVWATTGATQDFGLAGMLFTAIVVATVCGLVNGGLIAYGGLVSLIVTIAGMAGFRGLATLISGGRSQVVETSAFSAIATTDILGIPLLVYIFATVVAVGWLLLNRTTFGRHVFAIGGNPEAARLAGIDVRRVRATVFALSGLCCGIAAIMLTARTNTGASTHGTFYELDVIAAVILGGTLLTGGRGTLIGSILGVLVFTTVTNIFVLNNLSTPIQQIAKGVIIVVAVLLQRRANKEAAT
ncbi:monosaccharide ABC transporter membrane protein (CUT2 family) [Halopolyspora algeriensis]|uniref:Monosaccharide ABC transporter membrane protein (CUT2 family) n=1 Tax=Halopolyspora algeriensis TaxID=1500506 RepID=A0A368VWV3_9ACTN|nr:ABC transporter permease [Halopolyspora algeriensis]RCW45787.1 monosaccharide ABC transporter membrane protein (CUT2 family) [Halopolyspora algeriensis]TQM54171.1 monosaccharide ABC transporter membrane protein (CUT2 family) [Halopolyspora algeriensis]